jgi:hypothetical protein
VRFELHQSFHASPGPVCEAFASDELYSRLGDLPKLGRPQVLEHTRDGDVVELRIRYAFTGDLSAAARAVLDPAKLTWVEESTHDLTSRIARFTLVADHYRDRISCSGSYRFEATGDGTVRRTEGDLKVKAMLVGRLVEEAIISGLREHQQAEVAVVEEFVRSHS